MVGTIERRLLVNYRIDAAVLSRVLPVPFRPGLVGGYGIAGICMIRLKHLRARFQVAERDGRYRDGLESLDGSVRVALTAQISDELPTGSVFGSLEEASHFFRSAPLGYSATVRGDWVEALELVCGRWSLEPLEVERVESSFFENDDVFPSGSVAFDSAFLMRDIPASWRPREPRVIGGRAAGYQGAIAASGPACA